MPITPNISLSPLTLVHPIVGTSAISVDSGVLPIVVDADQLTTNIEVNINSVITIFSTWTLVNGKRRFSISPAISPTQQPVQVLLTGKNYDSSNPPSTPGFVFKATSTIQFTYLYAQSSSLPSIDPPSGIKIYRGAASCKIEWVIPDQLVGLLGVRAQISTDPTGIITPYQQVETSLITQISRSDNNVINSSTTTEIDPINSAKVTITTIQNTVPINYSQVVINQSDVNGADTFYIILSSVIQDPNTYNVYESTFNGPFTCGFVNLQQVAPTDFLTSQLKEDIATRLIVSTMQNYPDLDLTPRSELRDTLIDPVSLELSEQSVREWFARVSQSISAIATLDDYNGDGYSDSISSNPYKPIIKTAWNLSDTDTQTLIDKQFDILAERAGLARGGATTSVVPVTFYTYTKPSTKLFFDPTICQVSSVADADTPALIFLLRASATIDPNSASALWDATNQRWAIVLPFECSTTGSIGNVGAGSIRQPVSGVPDGWLCNNDVPAAFGTDGELNAALAARIKDRLVVGVDSGRRLGYQGVALATPGVVSANVIASGDLEMLRDWDNLRKKHIAGTVDVYVRGTGSSSLDTTVPFSYDSPFTFGDYTTYAVTDYTSKAYDTSNIGKKSPKMQFQVRNISSFTGPIAAVVDLIAVSNNSVIHLGTSHVIVNSSAGVISLDPNEFTYQIIGAGSVAEHKQIFTVNGVPSNNQAFMASIGSSNVTFYTAVRIASPMAIVPSIQPVTEVYSVVGNDNYTGVVSNSLYRLILRNDPLLDGFSNKSSDTAQVDSSTLISPPPVATLTFAPTLLTTGSIIFSSKSIVRLVGSWITDGVTIKSTVMFTGFPNRADAIYTVLSVTDTAITTLEAIIPTPAVNGVIPDIFGVVNLIPVVPIDTAMSLDAAGNILSVRSADSSTIYANGVDYAIVALGAYGSYGIRRLNSATTIPINTGFLVSYNKYNLCERCVLVTDTITLTGSTTIALSTAGMIQNVWVPESYGLTTLSMDGWNIDPTLYTVNSLAYAQIPKPDRYIKLTYNNLVMRPGQDYTLTVDPISKLGSITRITTGSIPSDASIVQVQYFVNETFDFTTGYPSFITQVANAIELMRHACGDVLVKNMMGNSVDVDISVEIASNTSISVIDGVIRTAIGVLLDNASSKLTQSELIKQVMNIPGVTNVQVPLTKFAKSNGSYDVGIVIPTGTVWNSVQSDPLFNGLGLTFPPNSFITNNVVLTDSTLPSGGQADSFVGLLYEGESFKRTMSIAEFQAAGPGAFYITGMNDYFLNGNIQIGLPNGKILVSMMSDMGTTLPSTLPFRVTYQVWEEGGTADITLSPTEYLQSGRTTISYIGN